MMNLMAYPAYFKAHEDGVYSVRVPDLDQFTEGYGFADAIRMAREVIGIALVECEERGEAIPAANSVEQGIEEGEEKSIVDIDFDEFKSRFENRLVKKNCSIPLYLEREAEKRGINFSKTLSEALIQKLAL